MKNKKLTYIIVFISLIVIVSILDVEIASDRSDVSNFADSIEDKVDNSLNDEEIKYDISTDEYFELINEIFHEIMEDNDNLYYDGFSKYYPYLQVAIKPKNKLSKTLYELEAKKIVDTLLKKIKEHKYESGNIFKYNYEYINIYFYDYDSNNKLNRNEGPFIQIEILNIDDKTFDDIIWK